MKDSTKNIIAETIIAVGLIIASTIYAFSNRYVVINSLSNCRIDTWTATYTVLTKK